MQTIKTDILIFGGGIAGLWLLNCLRSAGYSVILLEQERLGGQESINANGIIHGGLKFGLSSMLRNIEDLDDMPALWRDCLAGKGDLNLSAVKTLSDHQYIWSEANLAARATTFFASFLITGQVKAVEGTERPEPLQHDSFKGSAYRLSDLVIDMPSLVRHLASVHKSSIYKVSPQNCHLETDDRNNTTAVFITAAGVEPLRIHPDRTILAGGQGNAKLLDDIGLREPVMQRNEAHMTLLKRPQLPTLYAHCLGTSRSPRLTITTHNTRDGEKVWYIGGEIASEGALRDERMQIEKVQQELKTLLPWVDLRGGRYRTVKIERILPPEENIFQPDRAFVEKKGNNIVVWPCKLTLAPNVGRQVLDLLKKDNHLPQHAQPTEALPLLYPEMAQPVWEILFN